MTKGKTILLLLLLFVSAKLKAQTAPPDTVTVGAYVISVHDINFRDKEYTVRFWLWFLYDNPQFDFTKQLDIPNAKTIEDPEVIIDSVDGKAWVLLKMKCTMKEQWNVSDFPFDQQHLHVQIENTLFDNKTLVFKPDLLGSTINKKMAFDGWMLTDFSVSQGTSNYETAFGDSRMKTQFSSFATFDIDMNIERDAWGLFLKIFIGMYISFLIAIISFTPKPSELEPRFGLPVGGLFAAVGNKYVIDSLLPESSSFTLVDTLHTITFLGIFSTLLVSAIALKLNERGEEALSAKVNHVGSRIVIFGYVALNILFIILALR